MNCLDCYKPLERKASKRCSSCFYKSRRLNSAEIDNNAILRFNKNVKLDGDCLIWRGHIGRGGYGQFWYAGKTAFAHRVAYKLFVGNIPSGKQVCHACDRRSCVNVKHLWIGNAFQNMRDASQKGRMPIGDRNINTKLSIEQVRQARWIYAEYGVSQYEIARVLNVAASTINNAIRGKTFAWLSIQK